MQVNAFNFFSGLPFFWHLLAVKDDAPRAAAHECFDAVGYYNLCSDTLMENDCGFLIDSLVFIAPNTYVICVQANDQASSQNWDVFNWATPVGNGNQPNLCWTITTNSFPGFNIQHTVGDSTCSDWINIATNWTCPTNAVSANVEDCSLLTTIGIDLERGDSNYVISFGDGSLSEQHSSNEVVHEYGQPGTYQVCLTYLTPGLEPGYVTCCYPIQVVLPEGCVCPDWDVITVQSVEPCTWTASLLFSLGSNNLPLSVDFGDSTSGVFNSQWISHQFSAPGFYHVCYDYMPPLGGIIQCCEWVNIPGCCLAPSFTLQPDYVNGWESCYNPEYKITPTACLNPIVEVTHIWEFPDGEVFVGPYPPNQIFTNFLHADTQVCVTHTIICCDDSVSVTVCVDHFPAAYIGTAGGVTNLDDIVPTTGQTVLEFIQQNASNPALPLLIDGQLNINVANATFNGGIWNMGRESEIVVQGTSAAPRRAFELVGITIRSAVRLGPNFAACCRWKGIRSERLTLIRMVPATIMDANYAIHYPALSAGSPFPLIYSTGSSFVNNFYGIKSVGQHVLFSKFHANVFNGAPEDPHICGCTAVNAIDFQNVNSSTLNVTIDPVSFGNNEIFNYERALNFRNTRLIARGLNIHNLREYATSPGVPNNPVGESAIGIDFFWSLSSNSLLELNRASFTNFEELGTLSYAVRDRITRGRHTLRAAASALGSINTAGIAGGYDLNITSPGRLEVGSIISLNTIQTDGSNSAGQGFGITGNFTAANNVLEIRDNHITVSTNGADPMNGGIVLTSTEDLTQPFSIEHNTIDLALTNGVGIGVTGARGYCVRRNLMSNFSDATGIELSGGGDAVVECNEILFKPTGIDVMLSDENTYSGNFLSGNVNDMHFNGDNRGVTGSLIRWNEFNFSWAPSLVYDLGAFTGAQEHNSYNSWTGQGNQGGGNVEVQHASTNNSGAVLNSRFHRPSNALLGSVHFPNRTPSGMVIPAPNSTIVNIPSTFCNSTNGCFAMLAPQDPDPEVDYAAIVQDAATWSTMTAAEQTILRQGIYGHLLDNPTWLNGSSVLSGFKASQDASFVGQSETLRKAWLQLMVDIAAHQTALEPTYTSLNALGNQLQQWFDAIAADPSLEASLQGQIDATIQQGETLAAQLQQAEDQFTPTVQATIAQLLAQNAALDGTPQYAWNEKRYNEIALNWLAGSEPDAIAAIDLRLMAQSCLADGGRAVLAARGLCAAWLKEYYDEGNCSSFRGGGTDREALAGTMPSQEFLRIVPNPADDMVWIGLGGDITEGQQVHVFSIDGRQLFSGKLPNSGGLAIPVNGWQAGLYIVKITGDSKTVTCSFVVQHP